ncbi:GMC family oxidoreductase [Paraburkholderia sp. Tr-20389]|uniref:GMC oxidoreductase n=1 Tax=Paraburkholderia sp. Tr-20389 TaxID=2703903 RepID=UPI0019810DBF|nr:GMC family oxidoreductase [Paraburkholderia sp. Tr-20389]MBN3753653.1 GMC family oxidoreductase [Paraburkholderia sp. Tr-20389]
MKCPDVVIIGSGVGGGAVARQLAPTGARILILERGPRLPAEPENSSAEAVFIQQRYRAKEEWQTEAGRRFTPGQFYYVGGHTRFYGTAMFRFREKDFEEIVFRDGVSPAWPFSYTELEPWYAEAERIFGVHGRAGDDPTEPWRSGPYPHLPIPHEPVIGELAQRMAAIGLRPFHMPSAIDLHPGGTCVRCGTCDAFPCRIRAKGDAETRLIDPALQYPNVSLLTECRVTRLIADDAGKNIIGVEIVRQGEREVIHAPLFVLSAGAINSALLLQRSADSRNPRGLANSSDCVGRYYMNHNTTGLMALMPGVNETRFPKTLSVNDFYFGADDDREPLGNLQMLGKIQEPMIRAKHASIPRWVGRAMAHHSIDMLVMSEDLPHAQSTIRPLANDAVQVNWTRTNQDNHRRFVDRTKKLLRRLGAVAVLSHPFGVETPSHQCGTVRMGADPVHAALDPLCRTYDHPNLYVVDASFFPSSAALNPALTIAAQALRVGDHIARNWFGRERENVRPIEM